MELHSTRESERKLDRTPSPSRLRPSHDDIWSEMTRLDSDIYVRETVVRPAFPRDARVHTVLSRGATSFSALTCVPPRSQMLEKATAAAEAEKKRTQFRHELDDVMVTKKAVDAVEKAVEDRLVKQQLDQVKSWKELEEEKKAAKRAKLKELNAEMRAIHDELERKREAERLERRTMGETMQESLRAAARDEMAMLRAKKDARRMEMAEMYKANVAQLEAKRRSKAEMAEDERMRAQMQFDEANRKDSERRAAAKARLDELNRKLDAMTGSFTSAAEVERAAALRAERERAERDAEEAERARHKQEAKERSLRELHRVLQEQIEEKRRAKEDRKREATEARERLNADAAKYHAEIEEKKASRRRAGEDVRRELEVQMSRTVDRIVKPDDSELERSINAKSLEAKRVALEAKAYIASTLVPTSAKLHTSTRTASLVEKIRHRADEVASDHGGDSSEHPTSRRLDSIAARAERFRA